ENERRMMLFVNNMTISSGSCPPNIYFVETALKESSEDERNYVKT
ncbi:1270_t:CDS:1, partial [Dentiscutata heterogama]